MKYFPWLLELCHRSFYQELGNRKDIKGRFCLLLGKDDGPALTMHGKLKEPKKFQTPAPNKYEVPVYISQEISFK